ncbi:acyl-CoA carboxylase subunit epsilon [Gordonia sp. (in: high G+C Gram-positive bacteria)]|uniref:acyl-CoA carboxylase subunit epsilon n=1 Tax=Gordonia sp. (in: high G+C Gram-positive bacteria) TaxID=84139 RepID=UPI0039E534D6
MSGAKDARGAEPLVTIVKGNPTPAEVAALTAVLSAKLDAVESASNTTRDEWGNRDERLRPNWAAPTSFYTRLW